MIAGDLWDLSIGRPWIDPGDLADALERQADDDRLDFRTRLLIRDSLEALCRYWGRQRFEAWLTGSSRRSGLTRIMESNLGPPGFPTLRERIMDKLKPETIQEFLRDLGAHLPKPTRVSIGGSSALILRDLLHRATEDIDIVDELPVQIRGQHELLAELAKSYGLSLTHFQSHYLPSGWEKRLASLGQLGQLQVFLVDPYDIFVGKLFSARRKDLDDLRMLSREMDKGKIEKRLGESGARLLADAKLAEYASKNWYIIYGESLPA